MLGRGSLRRHLHQLPEPEREALRRGAAEDARPLHVARGIVPVHECTGKRGDATLALDLEHLFPHHVVVVERQAGKELVAYGAQQILHALGQPPDGRQHLARFENRPLEIRRVDGLKGLELDRRIEMPQHFGHRKFVLLYGDQVEPREPALVRHLAPKVEHSPDFLDPMGTIDQEHGPAIDLDRAIVAPRPEQIVEVAFPQDLVGPVCLFLEDVMIPAVPPA